MNRGIFCNRTLNLRSITAIGYDLDYTLVHYHVVEWERRAYGHLRGKLCDQGWPTRGLKLDPRLMIRGLILDLDLGNVVKADRFGYVKRACHGTRFLDWEEQRRTYAGTLVDLAEPRWVFLNSLFSLSEACMFAQLVDRLDGRAFPRVLSYRDLYDGVKASLDEAHVEGRLKAEIAADRPRFVDLDPETPIALLDQQQAGRKLLLITNSDWPYTRETLAYAFDRFLPSGTHWRDLFDLVIVGARKPDFFSGRLPLFEVTGDEGLLRPAPTGIKHGGVYHGGDATLVEEWLGVSGEQLLYVGDHVWGDVKVTKRVLRWRTALIVRELEAELEALAGFGDDEARLQSLMAEKEARGLAVSQLRLRLQRARRGRAPAGEDPAGALERRMGVLKRELAELDERITPLARRAQELTNPNWGPVFRAGNDKSHLARQVERSADVYTSRVSNFLHHTPFAYFRARRGSMPHDPGEG
jgi:5'-nucleotidase